MTTDRDREIDELVKELKAPHIERPDELNIGPGAMCFLNQARLCGPDCAAYVGEEALPHERCYLLVAAAGLPVLTQLLNRSAYTAGLGPIKPPDPMGGNR